MSNKLKNIIKLNVGNLLNEVDTAISDLPQKKVVDSDTAHNSAVAQATLGNIDQRFRELGVGVNSGAMHTPKLLAAMGSFNFGFKLGETEYKGQAKVVNQSPLTLVFKGSVTLGEEKSVIKDPTITFLGDLKTKESESGVDVTAVVVGGTYKVSVDSGKTQLVFGGDKKLVVDDKKRIRTVFDLTAKSGKTYKVSPNPDKQSDVVDGSANVTIVGGPQKNKSFAVPKSKLIKTDLSAFFPNGGGEPEMIISQEDSKGSNGEIEITHLPEIEGKEGGGKNNLKLELNNKIEVSGKLDVDMEEFGGSEDDLRKLKEWLKIATAELSGSQQPYDVALIKFPNDTSMMLKPSGKFPYYIKNWSTGMDVTVGEKAGELNLTEFKARVTLKNR